MRVFIISGNYVDNIILGYYKFFESIVRFIEILGRYDVVLDFFNVGYFSGFRFDVERVNSNYYNIYCMIKCNFEG